MKRKNSYDKNVYRSLTLIMQFGINMIVPIGVLSALGIWLDKRMDTSFWTVVLFFIGAVAGGQNVYRMAKPLFKNTGRDRQGREEKQRQSDENNRST